MSLTEQKQQLEACRGALAEAREQVAEVLEQQTATSEVLQVINNSPGYLTPVFEAMLASATRICGASFGNLLLYDGEVFRVAASFNHLVGAGKQRRRHARTRRKC